MKNLPSSVQNTSKKVSHFSCLGFHFLGRTKCQYDTARSLGLRNTNTTWEIVIKQCIQNVIRFTYHYSITLKTLKAEECFVYKEHTPEINHTTRFCTLCIQPLWSVPDGCIPKDSGWQCSWGSLFFFFFFWSKGKMANVMLDAFSLVWVLMYIQSPHFYKWLQFFI